MNRITSFTLSATVFLTGVALVAALWIGRGGPAVAAVSVGLIGFSVCGGILVWREARRRVGLVALEADLGRLAAGELELAPGPEKDAATLGVEGQIRDVARSIRDREGALRARADLFDRALAGVGAAVLATDADRRVTYMNRAAETLTGWRADEAIGHDVREVVLLDGDSSGRLEQAMARSESEDAPVPVAEWPVCLGGRSGKVGEVDVRVTALRLADGTASGFVLACSSSLRCAAEGGTSGDGICLATMIESLPIGVLLFRPDGVLMFANRHACGMFGFASEAVGTLSFAGLPHADDRARCSSEFRKVAAGELARSEFRMRCGGSDDQDAVAETVCLSLDMDGMARRILLLSRDVTESQRIARERRWEWEQRRLILDHTQELLLFLGTDLQVGWANRAADPDGRIALGPLACHELLFGTDEPCDGCPALMAMREGKLAEQTVVAGGRHLMVAARPVYSDSHELKGVVVSARDTSRMHEVERQLFQAQKLDALGRLAGGIAHDFNNMLNVVIGYVDLLGLEQREELKADYISSIMQAARSAEGLVRQLLAFSRSAGETKRTEVDVCALTRAFTKLVGGILGASIEVVVEVHNEPLLAHADAGQLEQAMMNLCINARDAMPSGGTLSIRTFPVSRDGSAVGAYGVVRRGQLVCCEIRDSGTGIPSKILARIFDPFFTTKVSGEGTGLGLSTTHAIVANHGGFLEVESELGQGSAFRILLPRLGDAEAKPDAAGASAVAAEFQARDGETVFVVEDDERLRSIVHGFLERAGYRVVVAGDGPQAMEAFDQHSGEFSLALLDVVLPGCSGIVVAHHILAQEPSLPILFCSGYPHDTVGIEEFEEKLISKPFRRLQLLRRIREELDLHVSVG